MFKYFLGLVFTCFVAVGFASCATASVVTQELYETLDKAQPGTFAQFRFYISQDVIFTEVVPPKITTDKDNTRVKITTFNNIVNIKRSTTGRVQGEPDVKMLEIAFEELKDKTKPTIRFVQKPEKRDNQNRYYFEYTIANWTVADKSGKLRTTYGPGIQYNGKTYLLQFKGKDEPYLLYNQDVKVKQSQKTMKGLK
ncbi:hypothetical protein [Treponema sp. R80B11-R83G3]